MGESRMQGIGKEGSRPKQHYNEDSAGGGKGDKAFGPEKHRWCHPERSGEGRS